MKEISGKDKTCIDCGAIIPAPVHWAKKRCTDCQKKSLQERNMKIFRRKNKSTIVIFKDDLEEVKKLAKLWECSATKALSNLIQNQAQIRHF